jgi:hypothetical protein
MVMAVLLVIVVIAALGWPSANYLWYRSRQVQPPSSAAIWMAISCACVATLSIIIWLASMRSGVNALVQMDRTPS